MMDQLRDARADLAELAIGRERLRISRDLHDLLGQSLSAVSLKGDLAIGLLARNEVPRAVGEIESLVSVARSALHDLRDIAHREPPIALSSEIRARGGPARVDRNGDARRHCREHASASGRRAVRLGAARRRDERAPPQRGDGVRHQHRPSGRHR